MSTLTTQINVDAPAEAVWNLLLAEGFVSRHLPAIRKRARHGSRYAKATHHNLERNTPSWAVAGQTVAWCDSAYDLQLEGVGAAIGVEAVILSISARGTGVTLELETEFRFQRGSALRKRVSAYFELYAALHRKLRHIKFDLEEAPDLQVRVA